MSSRRCLQQDIYDHITDLLRDDAEMLKQCCLVSKSWVPRTRKHLFSHIALDAVNAPEWRKSFPHPMDSPACYARSLTVRVLLKDADWGDWIQAFSCVERLIVLLCGVEGDGDNFLLPYHRLAPSLKSLRVDTLILPLSYTFDLIRSLPLLEDVTLKAWFIPPESHQQQTCTGSPLLTGTLEICVPDNLGEVLYSFLDLSGGLRFREVKLTCYRHTSLTPVTELVVACSDTLESFDIEYDSSRYEGLSIDLSRLTKLKEVVFRCRTLNSEWISNTLEKIAPEHRHLRQISIYVPCIADFFDDHNLVLRLEGETTARRWSNLDHLLVQFWESRSTRLTVACPRTKEKLREGSDWARLLVPELAKRRRFDLVDDLGESGQLS